MFHSFEFCQNLTKGVNLRNKRCHFGDEWLVLRSFEKNTLKAPRICIGNATKSDLGTAARSFEEF